MTLHGVGMDIFWNCTLPIVGDNTIFYNILENLEIFCKGLYKEQIM